MKGRNHIAKRTGFGDTLNMLPFMNGAIYYIIDGISGSNDPEKAARELDIFYKNYLMDYSIQDQASLKTFLELGHKAMLNEGIKKKSCIAGIAIVNSNIYTYNVGDVRVYGIRGEMINQLTKDDSVLQELIDSGEVSEEQSLFHEQKSFVTQSVGGETTPNFHVRGIKEEYEALLITSDGIHGNFLHRHLQYMLNESENLKEFYRLLFERSNTIDNEDDRTALLIYL